MRDCGRTFFNNIIVFCVIQMVFLQGCIIGDKIIYPIKLDSPPNTFRLSEKNWGGKLTSVKVFNYNRSKVLWHIKAISDMPIKDFVITVGKVPEGFEQIIPNDEKKFVLVSGEEYVIEIFSLDLSPPAFLGDSRWIAK